MNRSLAQLALALGGVVLLSGAFFAFAALSNTVSGGAGGTVATMWRPAWFLLGFELLVILAGILNILLARGRFGSVPFGLICVAGTIAVASLFGYLGSGGTVWGIALKPLLFARVGLALLIVALAGTIQLHARPAGVKLLFRGIILAAAAVGLGLLAYVLRNSVGSWSEILVLSLLMLGFVAVVGLIAASIDCLIRAFTPTLQNEPNTTL